MARRDFVPKGGGDFLAWLDNYKNQVAALAGTLGMSAGDVAEVAADNTLAHDRSRALTAAKATVQAAAADKAETFKAVIARVRALARRIKTSPAYTPALGEQLGIVGVDDTTDLSDARPRLRVRMVQAREVVIEFTKSMSDGVMVFSRRGDEVGFSFLGRNTASPYTDTRSNLVNGPETREYRAQYVVDDRAVGQLSDTVVVTVPG